MLIMQFEFLGTVYETCHQTTHLRTDIQCFHFQLKWEQEG